MFLIKTQTSWIPVSDDICISLLQTRSFPKQHYISPCYAELYILDTKTLISLIKLLIERPGSKKVPLRGAATNLRAIHLSIVSTFRYFVAKRWKTWKQQISALYSRFHYNRYFRNFCGSLIQGKLLLESGTSYTIFLTCPFNYRTSLTRSVQSTNVFGSNLHMSISHTSSHASSPTLSTPHPHPPLTIHVVNQCLTIQPATITPQCLQPTPHGCNCCTKMSKNCMAASMCDTTTFNCYTTVSMSYRIRTPQCLWFTPQCQCVAPQLLIVTLHCQWITPHESNCDRSICYTTVPMH